MVLVVAIALAVFWLPRGWGIAAVAAAAAFEVAEAALWIKLSRRRKPAVGAEALVGSHGVVVTACDPVGRVRVAGELWRARCAETVRAGERVVVERLEDDLTLIVRPSAADA